MVVEIVIIILLSIMIIYIGARYWKKNNELFTCPRKIAILIIDSDKKERWILEKKIWKKYMNTCKNIDCYFIRCNQSEPFTIDNNCIENLKPGIFKKTMLTLKRKRFDSYDIIIRTNLSTFFIFQYLSDVVMKLPLDVPLYTGKIEFWGGVQGMSIFLNQKSRSILLKYGLRKENLNNVKIIDDVLIYHIFMKNHVNIYRTNLVYVWNYEKDIKDNISIVQKEKFPLIRLKTKNLSNYEKTSNELLRVFYTNLIVPLQ